MNKHLSAKEEAQIETKLKRKITLCGLNEKEIRNLVVTLKIISHAVDEKDWDRIEMEELESIQKDIDTMTKAGCSCPPHGMSDPKEQFDILKSNIRAKNTEGASGNIKDILFAIASEI
jgi:hypothetical protein